MRGRFNDYRDFFNPHSYNVIEALVDTAVLNNLDNRLSNTKNRQCISKEHVIKTLNAVKKTINKYIDNKIKKINSDFKPYNGKYLVRVDYGYNGICSNRKYFAKIDGDRVDFFRDSNYQYKIPQSHPFDDVHVIETPSETDINEAKENGEIAWRMYSKSMKN